MPPGKATAESSSLKLPPCEGPKLGLFRYRNSPIQWHERLDESDDEDGTAEGYVFHATIRGREYAIKVFKFYNPMSSEYFWGPLMGEDTPLDTAAYYTDPFYAECRAYGRIQEVVEKKGKKQKNIKEGVAISHGFFFLQPKDQKYLEEQNIDLELDNVDRRYQSGTIGGCRARAIVKDLATPEPGVYGGNLQKILDGIISLNTHRIFNMDIRLENYRGGQLVDFGSSWTEPHQLLDALDSRSAEESRLADRVMFDQMVRDEKIPNPERVRAMHPMKLRTRHARSGR